MINIIDSVYDNIDYMFPDEASNLFWSKTSVALMQEAIKVEVVRVPACDDV